MTELSLIVCENFELEFLKAIEVNGFEDVVVKAYPSVCTYSSAGSHALREWWMQHGQNDTSGLLLCGAHCPILKKIPEAGPNTIVITQEKCFNHLAGPLLIEKYVRHGGYLVSSGWLHRWRLHMERAGFDRDTARRFYHEFAKTVMFLDSGLDDSAFGNLKDLSEYLDLPSETVYLGLDYLCLFLKSTVYEWRLRQQNEEYTRKSSEWVRQTAEYAALFDIISRLSSMTSEKDVISSLKDTFTMLFSSGKCIYWNIDTSDYSAFPPAIKQLLENRSRRYVFHEGESEFLLPVSHQDEILGVLEVGGFAFPQYVRQYLNFAANISSVCGLAISNARKYEKIDISEKSYKHISIHDAMTGIYNRAYFNQKLKEFNGKPQYAPLSLFVMDIDGLKIVNDEQGHAEGDKLIMKASTVLSQSFRDHDIIARIGGDEFAVLIPNFSLEKTGNIAQRLTALMNCEEPEYNGPGLSLSVGYAVCEDMDVESLFMEADKRMYAHKSSRRRTTPEFGGKA